MSRRLIFKRIIKRNDKETNEFLEFISILEERYNYFNDLVEDEIHHILKREK